VGHDQRGAETSAGDIGVAVEDGGAAVGSVVGGGRGGEGKGRTSGGVALFASPAKVHGEGVGDGEEDVGDGERESRESGAGGDNGQEVRAGEEGQARMRANLMEGEGGTSGGVDGEATGSPVTIGVKHPEAIEAEDTCNVRHVSPRSFREQLDVFSPSPASSPVEGQGESHGLEGAGERGDDGGEGGGVAGVGGAGGERIGVEDGDSMC